MTSHTGFKFNHALRRFKILLPLVFNIGVFYMLIHYHQVTLQLTFLKTNLCFLKFSRNREFLDKMFEPYKSNSSCFDYPSLQRSHITPKVTIPLSMVDIKLWLISSLALDGNTRGLYPFRKTELIKQTQEKHKLFESTHWADEFAHE